MWGCNLPFSGGWRGGFFQGDLLSFLFWAVVISLVVYLVIRIFRPQANNSNVSSQDRIDSLAILKARFAKGEISQEEFLKMKLILSQQ